MRESPLVTTSVTLLTSLSWVLVSSCAYAGEGDGRPIVRDSAGIMIVENDPARPGWTDPWTLSAEPVLRIGSAEEDTTQLLYQVTDSRRLEDGRILVVNAGAAQVAVYDANGQLLQTLGRRGEGPGEFRSPWQAYPMQGDSILVIDVYREIAIFDGHGAYAREFSLDLPDGMLGGESAEPVAQFGDGSLLFRGHYVQNPAWEGVRRNVVPMLRVPLDGGRATSLGDYVDQTAHYGAPYRGYAFGPWAKEVTSGSSMWYGPGDRFELRQVALDGSLRKLVRLDRPARPVTESDRDQYRRDYAEKMAAWNPGQGMAFWRQRAEDALFPDSFPVHYELKADALGNVWVQDYRSLWSEPRVDRVWSVFDDGGAYLGDVVVPGGLQVQDIGEEYLVGKWTDEFEVEYVHVYRIEKPEK